MACEACGREFQGHRTSECPWCGYDNGPGKLPRTEASMRRIERRRDREMRRLRREEA
jgi:rRNA maturation endonuclease Nob1